MVVGPKLAQTVRESGLIPAGSRGVALVSGGPDSACLAAGLVEAIGAGAIAALHLNYGLRGDSGEDEAIARRLCEQLAIELWVERPDLGEGNVQDQARRARYEAAERLRSQTDGAWVATGQTRSDLAETVIYRLATSPGSRALLGMPARSGAVVRPLLALDRAETRRLATEAGLPFRDDPSNRDRRYARVRIRDEVLPVLRELSPAAERNIALTRAELAEEAAALEQLAAGALEAAGAVPGVDAVQLDALEPLHPALRRIALRVLAERAAGRQVPLGRDLAAEIWRLGRDPEGGEVDLGGGLRAVCEAGTVRIAAGHEPDLEPAALAVPGACRFGRWELRAELREGPGEPAGPEIATLDADALGAADLTVRSWREGDRIHPLGLDGTKSLQDLFSDRGVPRSLRRSLPVVVAAERIVWVAGVAIADEVKLRPDSERVAVLTATAV